MAFVDMIFCPRLNEVVEAEYAYNQLGQQITRRLTQTGVTIHSVYESDSKLKQ